MVARGIVDVVDPAGLEPVHQRQGAALLAVHQEDILDAVFEIQTIAHQEFLSGVGGEALDALHLDLALVGFTIDLA